MTQRMDGGCPTCGNPFMDVVNNEILFEGLPANKCEVRFYTECRTCKTRLHYNGDARGLINIHVPNEAHKTAEAHKLVQRLKLFERDRVDVNVIVMSADDYMSSDSRYELVVRGTLSVIDYDDTPLDQLECGIWAGMLGRELSFLVKDIEEIGEMVVNGEPKIVVNDLNISG